MKSVTASASTKPRRRVKQRKLYEAKATVDGDTLWIDAKGAHRTVTDAEGNVVSTQYEATSRIWSNKGDGLVICGPTLDENAFGRVVDIGQDGRLRVRVEYGTILPTTTKVRVMTVRRAA